MQTLNAAGPIARSLIIVRRKTIWCTNQQAVDCHATVLLLACKLILELCWVRPGIRTAIVVSDADLQLILVSLLFEWIHCENV